MEETEISTATLEQQDIIIIEIMIGVCDETRPPSIDHVDYIMAEEEIIMEEEMCNTLPQEIILEILSWLPAESLISKINFVCKAWRTLIHDPGFVKMHLKRGAIINGGGGGGGRKISNNNDNNNNYSLICKSGNALFQLHPPFNCEGVPIAAAKKLDFDLLTSPSRLVGSCNGLVCIRVIDDDQNIILLNPSTSKYKVLPKEPVEYPIEFKPSYPFSFGYSYGFGCYDSSNTTTTTAVDEYKVVRIAHFYRSIFDPSFHFQIDIYSMSSNSWRRMSGIKDFPALISKYRPALFLSGAVHWIGSYNHMYGNHRDVLISIDISRDEEAYRPVAMPPCVGKPSDMMLINMRGWLGIICVYRPNKITFDLDIWVMKEYGIRESWTRECVIRSSNTDPPRVLSGFSLPLISMAYVLKGDQILINRGYGRMALYDMNTKKIDRDFEMVGVPDEVPDEVPMVDLVDYIETLVSLKSSKLAS